MNDSSTSVALSLTKVKQELNEFEQLYHRQPQSVQLLAVSKRKPISAIQEAIAEGHRAFGENYVDEGVEKILTIADPTLEWHFIGTIQSRKCADIAQHFQWAHGVDRLKVASKLSANRPSGLAPLNICLQVNLDNEASKAGITTEEVQPLAQACSQLPGIRLRGLMAIPAPRTDIEQQRHVFARLRQCLASLQETLPQLDTLSMGMSADMQAAVAEGATIVRVGTAIFGSRDTL